MRKIPLPACDIRPDNPFAACVAARRVPTYPRAAPGMVKILGMCSFMRSPNYFFMRATLESSHQNLRSLFFVPLALFLFALCGGGCKTPVFIDFTSAKAPEINSATNLLQEGDLVSITFQFSTNFNATQKVPLDGLLNLESIGPVKAAGRTPVELQTEVARLYRPQIKDDVVTVKLLSAATAVYVSGAVFHAGRIPMERPLTALEAVMEAGGFDPNRARLSAVTVVRIDGGRQKTFHVDLKRALQGKSETPFYLKPFDIVHVPTKTFNF
jgi:polysaccharide export outer membrane protein